jgi:hypothetical protein
MLSMFNVQPNNITDNLISITYPVRSSLLHACKAKVLAVEIITPDQTASFETPNGLHSIQYATRLLKEINFLDPAVVSFRLDPTPTPDTKSRSSAKATAPVQPPLFAPQRSVDPKNEGSR